MISLKRITAVFAAALIIFAAGCSGGKADDPTESREAEESSVQSGEQQDTDNAPERDDEKGIALRSFKALAIGGEEYTEDIFKDHDVTIIYCWTTYCGYCIEEMPDIAEYAENLPGNVQLITWCMDGAYEGLTAQDLISESGYTGITFLSGEGDLFRMASEIMYVPTTLFVDSSGIIRGEPVVGAPADVKYTFDNAVNKILSEDGKQEMP